MKAVVTLTSSESKRLIAKAVVKMKEVQRAWENAYLLISDGTTNAMVSQELLDDRSIRPEERTIGISTEGLLCVNSPRNRTPYANVFYKGNPMPRKSFAEALADYHDDTVVIKGANAIDAQGVVGIITTGFDGGTIPRIIGPVSSKGLALIVPVGLEKLVPSVPQAVKAFNGAKNIHISLGASGGMFCLYNAIVVTEIEAVDILFQIKATPVCCGGVGGNEGSVTLVLEGQDERVTALVEFLERCVKGEPAIIGRRGDCKCCRYVTCRYHGMEPDELPVWMSGQEIYKHTNEEGLR